MYRAGLLALFNIQNSPEEETASAGKHLIMFFLVLLTGSYSESTLENYKEGLQAWHIIHKMAWLNNNVTAIIKQAAARAKGTSCQ